MKKILVVDDSATARMFTARCMEIAFPEEVEFIEAGDGKEAYNMLKDHHFDLVLSDLNMPVMDGVEFVRRISASPKFHGLPVIVITSSANPEVNDELYSMGAACVVEKPLTPMKMTDALNTVETFRQEGGAAW
ncbi:hypothetical protein BVX99_02615 [bacterium F16]|nr:hypothetical protein BVX99_02615 [bacterium F16]